MRFRDAMALTVVALLAACAQVPVATNAPPDTARPGPAEDARAQAISRHQHAAQQARESGDLAPRPCNGTS